MLMNVISKRRRFVCNTTNMTNDLQVASKSNSEHVTSEFFDNHICVCVNSHVYTLWNNVFQIDDQVINCISELISGTFDLRKWNRLEICQKYYYLQMR